jgi:hypothetical protein
MGKIRALGTFSLAIAWLGLGGAAVEAQSYPPQPPPNVYSDAGPPPLEFAADAPDVANQSHPHWELSSELVFFYFQRPQTAFPLVTAGSPADAVPGALGQPGTTILADSNPFLEHLRSGARFTATGWLTDEPERLGVQASYFIMQQAVTGFAATSQGNAGDAPVLARPFFNVGLGREDALLVANTGLLAGSTNLGFSTRLMGADASLLYNVSGYNRYGPNLFLLAGPRFLRFDERYASTDTSTDLATSNTSMISDNFGTSNLFYGGQVGAQFRYRLERLTFDLTGKVAAGVNDQTLTINGFSSVTNPTTGLLASANQGLFAQQSNIGQYTHRAISVMPELGLKLHLDVTDNVRFSLGYGYLNMSHVARPGDQLDRNATVGAGFPARPTSIAETNFWTQYFSFGLELVF